MFLKCPCSHHVHNCISSAHSRTLSSSVALPTTNIVEVISRDANTFIFQSPTTSCVDTVGIQHASTVMVVCHNRAAAHASFSITCVLQSSVAPKFKKACSLDIAASRTNEAFICSDYVLGVTANLSRYPWHWITKCEPHPVGHI